MITTLERSARGEIPHVVEFVAELVLATSAERLCWRHCLADGRLLLVSARIVADDGDRDPAVLLDRIEQTEQMRRRAVQEAVEHAQTATWLRRAEALEDARSRPSDWPGNSTEAQRQLRDHRLAEDAAACREHAAVLGGATETGWAA